MKTVLVNIILAVANLLSGPLKAGAQGLAMVIAQVNLPDGDAKWAQVGDLIAEALRDMAAARDLDADTAMQVRLAAERRVHLQLRELGLLDRSEA